MNAILGMLELATEDPALSRHSGEWLRIAAGLGAHGLLDLLGDSLDIASIEAGQMTLTPDRPARSPLLLVPVTRVFRGMAEQKGLAYDVRLPDSPLPQVLIDPFACARSSSTSSATPSSSPNRAGSASRPP